MLRQLTTVSRYLVERFCAHKGVQRRTFPLRCVDLTSDITGNLPKFGSRPLILRLSTLILLASPTGFEPVLPP